VDRKDKGYSVALAPDVLCYKGAHLQLAMVACVLGCFYSYLLIPHTVVRGDTDYVQYAELFQPGKWRGNAERFSTLVYLGIAHPYKQHAFGHALFDLLVRITLPCITIMSTSLPLFQVVAVAVVGILHFVASVVWLPYVNKGFCAFEQGMRLMTLCAMLCGILTVINDGAHKILATALLCLSITCVAMWTVYRMCHHGPKVRPDESPIVCRLDDEVPDETIK